MYEKVFNFLETISMQKIATLAKSLIDEKKRRRRKKKKKKKKMYFDIYLYVFYFYEHQ
jgi:hypothetical protein